MKKFSSFTGMLLTALLVVVVFAACQKEQSSTVNQETASTSSDETTIVRTAGTGNLPGEISPSYAASLAYNYSKQYDDDNQTQYVAFNAKDLVAFINNLQTKYKSDMVYVNFGVYGKNAPAVNPKDNGRLTVFFTGNKIPSPSASSRRNNGIFDITDVTDEFLNHGGLLP